MFRNIIRYLSSNIFNILYSYAFFWSTIEIFSSSTLFHVWKKIITTGKFSEVCFPNSQKMFLKLLKSCIYKIFDIDIPLDCTRRSNGKNQCLLGMKRDFLSSGWTLLVFSFFFLCRQIFSFSAVSQVCFESPPFLPPFYPDSRNLILILPSAAFPLWQEQVLSATSLTSSLALVSSPYLKCWPSTWTPSRSGRHIGSCRSRCTKSLVRWGYLSWLAAVACPHHICRKCCDLWLHTLRKPYSYTFWV